MQRHTIPILALALITSIARLKFLFFLRGTLVPFAVLAMLLSGCSDEFTSCIRQWSSCSADCPSTEEEQQTIVRIEADYRDCLDRCPVLDPSALEAQQLAAGRCIKGCSETQQDSLAAATRCNDTCDEASAGCISDLTTCDDIATSRYLRKVQIADWDKHASQILADPADGVFICADHFAPGSPQGDEIERAVRQYDSIPGTSIGLYPLWHGHQTKSEIFGDPPGFNSFDYVDNANDLFIHPCHPNNTIACSDSPDGSVNGFAINTCRYGNSDWKGGGDTEFFSITANANCYDYLSDPTSSDYVLDHGALHELGHAAGMEHPKAWPEAEQLYISTMQGKLTYLSAYDVAFLRHFYPEPSLLPWRNFVASSKIRIDFGGPNEVNGAFGEKNPSGIYLVGDRVYDCATQQDATWFAAWFNTGLTDQQGDHCMVNELRIEEPGTLREVLLRRWHAANMPKESQDQWQGSADVGAADFTGLPLGVPLDLVFEVNVYEQWREPSQDNEVRAPIILYGSSACTPPNLPSVTQSPPIKQVAPDVYEIEPAFVTQLTTEPERIFRGASIVPARIATAGIGFKLFRVEPGSIAAALGVQEGDILWRVAGNPITGPNTAFAAVKRLMSNLDVHVVIVRNQSQRQLTYRLR